MSPTMLMASRGKRSYVADTDPCSSTYVPAKRTRHSTESAQNGLSDSRYILRPGIPPAIRVGEYRFADKPSPPLRTPNEVTPTANRTNRGRSDVANAMLILS
jgi:hypothetical protein